MELTVYLIKREFLGADVKVFGRAVGEWAEFNLANATLIRDEKDIDSRGNDAVAVIYNDTPLCTLSYLQEKHQQMQKHNISKYYIGDGYIADCKVKGEGSITAADEVSLKINSLADIALMYDILKLQTAKRLLESGVMIMDASSTYIEPTVAIGKGSIIYPMSMLQGATIIGEGVAVYPYSQLTDTCIGDNTVVNSSYSVGAIVGRDCTVGPFACLRKGTVIGDNCRIGDYVEIKNSILKDNVKAAHLAYIGDSFVDSGTNVGCGAVFANFDGKKKRGVHVGKNVFIGANANLIAPLSIGDEAFIAAGSTITKDVPNNSLCIARSREVVKQEYNFRTP